MFHLHIFFGDGEYTSNTSPMDVAREYVRENPQHFPIFIMVVEHAGWFEMFYFGTSHPDGIRINTANDCAKYSEEVHDVRRMLRSLPDDEIRYLPEIRRPPYTSHAAQEDEGSAMEGDRFE